MTLQEALNASPYDVAEIEIGSLSYVVDGSIGGGEFTIKSGVTGMPISSFQGVQSLEEALEAIKKLDVPLDGWEPIDEEGI